MFRDNSPRLGKTPRTTLVEGSDLCLRRRQSKSTDSGPSGSAHRIAKLLSRWKIDSISTSCCTGVRSARTAKSTPTGTISAYTAGLVGPIGQSARLVRETQPHAVRCDRMNTGRMPWCLIGAALAFLTFTLVASGQTCASAGYSPPGQHQPAASWTATFGMAFTAPGCTWSVSTDASWISVQGATSGTNSTTYVSVPVNGSPNTSSSPRSGSLTLTVNGKVYGSSLVYQNSNSCTYSISPSSVNIPTSGGSGSFTVTPSPATCWVQGVSGIPNWLPFTENVSGGIGPDVVTYSAPANSSLTRATSLSFYGGGTTYASIKVIQSGPPPATLPAGSPTYAFRGTADAGTQLGFTTTTSNFFTPGTTAQCPGYGCIPIDLVAAGTCIGCNPPIIAQQLDVALFAPHTGTASPYYDVVAFFVDNSPPGGSGTNNYYYYFRDGAFSTPGTYSTVLGGYTGTLTVTGAGVLPTLISITPNSGAAGTTVPVTLSGTSLTGATVIDAGSGITVSGLAVVGASQITASFAIAANAASGTRNVTVTTPTCASNAVTFTVNTPLTVSSLSPNFVAAGGSAFTMTVNGTGYVSGSTVQWNGSALPTSYVTGNQLTALVPANLIASPASVAISVLNPGGATSNALAFPVNSPTSPSPLMGTNLPHLPLDYSALACWSGRYLAQGFSVTTPIQVTGISLEMFGFGTDTFTLWVTDKVGSGTTAADVLFQTNLAFPNTGGTIPGATVSTSPNLALSPGNYFLVVSSSGAPFSGSGDGWIESTAMLSSTVGSTTANSVSALSTNTTFPPASTFSNVGNSALAFQLSGAVIVAGPTIASLSPNTAIAGGPAFALTVNGSGFLAGSIVQWGGSALSTSYVSGNQLTASVSVALIASQGSANVFVQNPNGATSNALSFTINPPTPSLSSLSPNSATAGGPAFTLTVNGSGFVAGSTVQWNGSALPTSYVSGNQLSTSVAASLIASQGSARVAVLNPGGLTSNALTFTITAAATPVAITTSPTLPAGATYVYYSQTLSATGGTPPYTWDITSNPPLCVQGSLLGLALSSTGVLRGSPDLAGTCNFTVQVIDSAPSPPGQATKNFSVAINATPAPTLTSINPSSGVQGTSVPVTLTGANFIIPAGGFYGSSVFSSNPGITVSNVSVVSSTTIIATVSISASAAQGPSTVTVNTSPGNSNPATFTVNPVGLQMTCTPVSGPVQVGSAYTAACTVSGGTAPYNWSIASGTLPTGVSLGGFTGSSASVSGTPSSAGVYSYTVKVTDSSSPLQTGSQNYSGTIAPAANTLTFSCTPATGPTQVGVAYSATCNVSGGTAPYTWSIGSGALPAGLSLSGTTGTIISVSGTPTTAGSYAYAIEVTTATGGTGSQNYSGTVSLSNSAPTIISLSPNAAAVGGGAFALTVSGTGFVNGSAVQWNGTALICTIVSATEIGCTVPANVIASAETATVVVVNPGGLLSNSVPFVVGTSSLTISTSFLPGSVVGTAYSLTLSATGGAPPYSNWVVSTGSLPPGLTLNATNGVISGLPSSAAGSPFSFTVIVKDSSGAVSSPQGLSITVSQPSSLTIITASPLTAGTVGVPYSQAFAATSGVTPYRNWVVTVGTIPPGMSLSTLGGFLTGLLSGTPRSTGSFSFSIQVTDSVGATATKQFSIVIKAAGTVTVTAVVNSASYAGGGVAPGEIVTIFGSGMGPNTPVGLQLDSNGNVARTLSGVQVLFDSVAAPLVYVQSNQVSAVVPYEVAAKTSSQVSVVYQNQTSAALTAPVVGAAPGIFTIDSSGSGAGSILNQDGTVNSTTNPVAAGSYIFVYATGEGQTNPAGSDGTLDGSPAPQPVQKVTATIGGASANLVYAGGSPGLVAGVLQVNLQVPQTLPSGNAVPVVLNVGGATSQASVTIAVKGSGTGVPPLPTLASISPNTGAQGATVPVALTGTNFVAGASVSVASSAVTVSNVNVLTENLITATFTIGQSVSVGSLNVTVTTGGGTSGAVTFNVSASTALPTLASISPNPGTQGGNVPITLTGTNFAIGAAISVGNSSVTVGNVNVVSSAQITAVFSIASAAAIGPCNVTVTTAGGTSAAVTFAISSSPIGSLSITAVSTATPLPLTPLYISTSGVSPSASLSVQFSNAAGYSVTEQPLRIASDGTIAVAVPLYIDPVTHATASSSVSVNLTQGNQSTAPVNITIQDLPSVSSYGTQPGQISHAFFVYEAMLIARRINEFQAYQKLPGNKVDTSGAQASLRMLLNDFIQARNDIDYVSINQGLVIAGGTLSNGFPIQFDQTSLDLMDRIIGLHLSQISSVITSAPTIGSLASATAIPSFVWPHHGGPSIHLGGEVPAASVPGLATVLNVIDGATNQIGLQQAISDYYNNDATAKDKGLAVAGGLGSLYNQMTLGAEGTVALVGSVYGAVVSSVTLLNNLGMELGDLGFLMYASHYGGDQAVITEATNDLNNNAADSVYATINTELSLLTAEYPESALLKTLALVSAVEQCNSTSCYSNLESTSIQAGAETSTIFGTANQGFAIVDGSVQTSSTFGVAADQNEVQLSSNGVAFNSLADESGNYQIFVSLQADPFDYAAANLQIIDPTTQNSLNIIDPTSGNAETSEVIDLNGATTTAASQLPIIHVQLDCSAANNACLAQCGSIWNAPSQSIGQILYDLEQYAACEVACAIAACYVLPSAGRRFVPMAPPSFPLQRSIWPLNATYPPERATAVSRGGQGRF